MATRVKPSLRGTIQRGGRAPRPRLAAQNWSRGLRDPTPAERLAIALESAGVVIEPARIEGWPVTEQAAAWQWLAAVDRRQTVVNFTQFMARATGRDW